ncbi:MAG: cobalamin-dependent protein [Pseudomonadota bacterium]
MNGQAEKSVGDHQDDIHKILQRVVSGEVIPRVYKAQGEDVPTPQDVAARIDEQAGALFQKLLLNGDNDACMTFIQAHLNGGLTARDLCLGLFTQTARNLGEEWNNDALSFAEVTMALGALHMLVHQLCATDEGLNAAGARHNIILASAPAEQHAFGVLLVSKIFEMEGWLVTGGPDLHTGAELTTLVSQSWFDVVGLTASSEELARSLTDDIKALREISLNKDVVVLVGGSGFSDHPEIHHAIGADELARDADDAVAKARTLLAHLEEQNAP